MTIPRVGKHYRGELGDAYFSAYEAGISGVVDEVESRKFAMYVAPGDAVVDFGCGNGGVLACLNAGTKVGIEVNERARQAASQRGISVVAATEELPDQCADIVISNHALEHTVAPFEELKELRRILKPRGRLVLWLPLDDWRAQRRIRRDPNHHLYAWTPLLLKNLLAEAGFVVHECRVVTHAWHPFFVEHLARVPNRVFDAVAFICAVLLRRRQLRAIASPA